MKKILLIITLLFALTGCAAEELYPEDIIGVWRTATFEEDVRQLFWGGSAIAVYITYDGSLFIHHTTETSIGELTQTSHFGYEIIDNQLALTSVRGRSAYDIDAINIAVDDNRIILDLRQASRFVNPSGLLFTLYRIQDYVPFGWAESDQQAMSDSRVYARDQIRAFAERLSDALGLPVLPYDGRARTDADFVYRHILPFTIKDTVIQIAFIGDAPTPTHPQSRHVWEGNPLIDGFKSVSNADRRFAFVYSEWGAYVPEEWIGNVIYLE